MAPERDERLCLSDILGAIDRAVDYIRGGREAFLRDPKTQDAVIHKVTVIGQAIRGVSESTRRAHPEIPWTTLGATADGTIHDYYRVDLDLVWGLVANELPRLRHQIADLLPVIKSPLS